MRPQEDGSVTPFNAPRCDRPFVLVDDGRRWLIPAEAVQACSALLLGGPGCERFAIQTGRPIVSERGA